MKTLTVTATFQARPGKEAELRAALIGLLAPTRKEASCMNLSQSALMPARLESGFNCPVDNKAVNKKERNRKDLRITRVET